MSTASRIAAVVADIRANRYQRADKRYGWPHTQGPAKEFMKCPVIDSTELYKGVIQLPQYNAYEDYPCIIPPWNEAFIGYENRHGNIICSMGRSIPKEDWQPGWETDVEVDWKRVEHVFSSLIFIGGTSPMVGGTMPTTGPIVIFKYAIYEDGTPADLHWEMLSERGTEKNWDDTTLVILSTLNFMNCRNVELVEPIRERAERRRIERTGVRVSVMNVYPAGKSSASRGEKGEPIGVPLSSVRGHFARYGDKYGRGKLFGKYEGRFWIPQYARGSAEFGEIQQEINIKP